VKKNSLSALTAFLALSAAPTALAEDLEVERVSVGMTNCAVRCNTLSKSAGPNAEWEVVLESPDLLNGIGSPSPYLVASINTAGETSFAGGGLQWRRDLTDDWALEASFGYVLHSGYIEDATREHVSLGSRDLFHISLGVVRDLPGPWEATLLVEHLSHGQIIGRGRNQGLDQIGLRLGYRLNE